MFGTFDFETTWGFKAFDLHALRTRTGAPVATQAAAKAASSAPVAICSGNHGRFSEYKALYFCVCVCVCMCGKIDALLVNCRFSRPCFVGLPPPFRASGSSSEEKKKREDDSEKPKKKS